MTVVEHVSKTTGIGTPARPWWFFPAIVAILAGAVLGSLVPAPTPSATLTTPEQHVAAYLAATSAGQVDAALAVWVQPPWSFFDNSRRVARTRELAEKRVGRAHSLTRVHYQDFTATVETPDVATFAEVRVDAANDSGAHLQLAFIVARVTPERFEFLGVSGGKWTLIDVTHAGECTELGC